MATGTSARKQCRPRLDEQIDVVAMQADHVGVVVSDPKSEMLDVECGGTLWVWRLNQNIGTKAVRHVSSLASRMPSTFIRCTSLTPLTRHREVSETAGQKEPAASCNGNIPFIDDISVCIKPQEVS